MNVHEYQGKEILRGYGVATPRGIPCFSVRKPMKRHQARGKVWVVKAQIHAGGRGKGGGVKVAKSLESARARPEDPRNDTRDSSDGPSRRVVNRCS